MCDSSNVAPLGALICKHCGVAFEDANKGRRGRKKEFCSDACRNAAHKDARREAYRLAPPRIKKRPARKCKGCSAELSKPRIQFCSDACLVGAERKFRFTAIPVCKCKNCGGLYIQKQTRRSKGQGLVYCGRDCYFEDHSRKKQIRDANRLVSVTVYRKHCAVCGAGYWSKQQQSQYCSDECKKEAQRRKKWLREPFPGFFCAECGTAYVPLHRGKNKFCTAACGTRYHRRASGRKHHHRARRFGVEYESVNRLKVFERDGWRCQICGKETPQRHLGTLKPNAPELDHRIPMSRGGPHTYDNVQCACRQCNGTKGNFSEIGQIPLFSIG